MTEKNIKFIVSLILTLIMVPLLTSSSGFRSGSKKTVQNNENHTYSGKNHADTQYYVEEEKNTDITDTELTATTPQKVSHIIPGVPYINQRRDFPNGCESVSAVMAMQYFGIDITPEDFIEKYLDMGKAPYYSYGMWYGCDPKLQFPGDPRTSAGWGCYPEVIKKAIDKMELTGYKSYVLKDVPLSSLCSEYIDNNIPVIFWATIDMRKPGTHRTWIIEGTDRTHTWINPFHCLLLVGYDSEYYYFNDPWQAEYTAYPAKEVETAYAAVGRHSAVIIPSGLTQ